MTPSRTPRPDSPVRNVFSRDRIGAEAGTPDGRSSPLRLDLRAIEATLRQVQARFDAINAGLLEPRDKLDDRVIGNMMAGYRLVDDYVAAGVDLFAMEEVGGLLEVNTTVLCGEDPARRRDSASHIAATERRFYEQQEGGIGDLLEWYEGHRGDSVWMRAAGTFVRMLSKPQLFIEGNHRSGALIMSYILLREGRPPFVLSVDNARAYFNPTTLMRKTRKKGLATFCRLPRIRARYAEFLQSHADARFLLDAPAMCSARQQHDEEPDDAQGAAGLGTRERPQRHGGPRLRGRAG